MAMTNEELANYYVDFIMNSANQYQYQFLDYANDAEINARNSYSFSSDALKNPKLDLVNFIGVSNANNYSTITDLRNEFDSKYHYLFDVLNQTVPTEFSTFINTYFPKPTGFDNLEQFLVDSVTNGSIGLPKEIENQLWEQERERTATENKRVILENRKSMASRGFIEPNGVEAYREMVILNQGSKNISGSSRQIAVDSAKLKIDWVKFAVQEARNYRTLALESAFKYLANVLSTTDPAFKYASGYVDSYKTFYDTVNSYYNSINSINRLELEKANFIDKRNYDYDRMSVDMLLQNSNFRNSTLTELARMMGTQAGAALSGVNALFGVSVNQTYTSQAA